MASSGADHQHRATGNGHDPRRSVTRSGYGTSTTAMPLPGDSILIGLQLWSFNVLYVGCPALLGAVTIDY